MQEQLKNYMKQNEELEAQCQEHKTNLDNKVSDKLNSSEIMIGIFKMSHSFMVYNFVGKRVERSVKKERGVG